MTINLSRWISQVRGTTKLSEISIPGTHDSAARYIDPTGRDDPGTSPRLTTQTAGIAEQLNAGIRFLDIRVGYTANRFQLYHEDVSLNLDFGAVRDICRSFLQANPGETIIMSLKVEDNAPDSGNTGNVTFQGRFLAYVNERPGLWYLLNTIPTVKDARGKIVLFRRFALDNASQPIGIDAFDGFPDDGTKTFGGDGRPTLSIQDKFNQSSTSKQDKWDAVVAQLTAAQGGAGDTLFVNFTSAAGVAPVDFPISVANFINPKLVAYFNSHRTGRFGIVAMDFQTIELNRLIVLANGSGG